ncbi:MAG: enoyl-CoA hydratase/isomerase family protein, partial [Persicimonas sp.]
ALEALDFPVVALVDGYALGGGCEMALACDFIYATQDAVFGQPEVSLGLIPGFGGCVRLVRRVGPGRARELIYSGRKIEADEAHRIGLVNRVFETREAMNEAAEDVLEEIAGQSPTAVGICKSVIGDSLGRSTRAGLAAERKGFLDAFRSPDKQEGVRAFLAKETPNFKGGNGAP